MKHNIDLKNDFDTAVLAFIKTVYIQSRYDKDKVRLYLMMRWLKQLCKWLI